MEGRLSLAAPHKPERTEEDNLLLAGAQAMLDPEAAAQARMRKQERRAVGRKRAMEETRRMRSAGVAVKHKRPRAPRRTD